MKTPTARELGARARRNRSGHVAAGRRAACAGHTRAAREQPPPQLGHRRGARHRRGWRRAAAAEVRQRAESRRRRSAASRRTHRSGRRSRRRRAEELTTQHTELSKRAARSSTSHAAAQWGGTDFAAARKSLDEIGGMLERRKYESAPAPLDGTRKVTGGHRGQAAGSADRADSTEGKRALNAGEFENARQAFDTALKIDPAESGSHRVARQGGGRQRRGADARRRRERRSRQATCPRRRRCSPTCSKRNPGNVAATEGLARVKHAVAEQAVQCRDGRRAGRAQRRTPGRGAHASRTRQPAQARQRRSSCRAAACRRHRQRTQHRGTRPSGRRAWPREERWTEALAIYDEAPGAGPFAAVCRKPAARRSRRGRNWASGCRHS